MTPDNRALWELVEKWKLEVQDRDTYNVDERSTFAVCYRELRALLERPVVVGAGEVRLWDTQWMNIVNHDNCYRDWSKDDAIAHAVKMTEEAIARNVVDGKLPPSKDALESMVRGKS